MSVRGVIPILSRLMHSIIRRSIFFRKILPSVLFLQVFTIHRDKSLSLRRYLAFIPLNSEAWFPSSHLYFPGRNTGSLPRPLSIWKYQAYNSLKTLGRGCWRADWSLTSRGIRLYARAHVPCNLPDPALSVAPQVGWEPRHHSDSNHTERGAERKQTTKSSWHSQDPASYVRCLLFGQGAATPHLSALGTRWAARLVSSSKTTTWYQHFDNLLGNKSAPVAG